MRTAASGEVDLLQQLAMAGAAAFHDQLAEEFMARIMAAYQAGASPAELVTLAQEILETYAPHLAGLLADAELAAMLAGAGQVASSLPGSAGGDDDGGEPPVVASGADDFWDGDQVWRPVIDLATEDLATRNLLLKPDYEKASAVVREQSFTVAGQRTTAALEDIRAALVESVSQGTGYREFGQALDDALGEGALGPGHLANVFRTNIGQSYHNSMAELVQAPVVRDAFPYAERMVIDDTRISELCETLAKSGIDGTAIYRVDDPVWLHFRPLSHFQCRCGTRYLTLEQAAERLKSARAWLETGDDPHDFVPWPAVELPRGWSPGGGG